MTVKEIIQSLGGKARTSELLKRGVQPRALYALRDQGEITELSRGLFCLTDLEMTGNQDLATIAYRVPQAVVCLISALSFHQLTTQIPFEVSIAVPNGSHLPKISYPPTKAHRFSEASYEQGIQEQLINGVNVRIYGPEKTLVDCFKFRNKVGMDVVLEAFSFYRKDFKMDIHQLLHYGKVCRVDKIMKPYLESWL